MGAKLHQKNVISKKKMILVCGSKKNFVYLHRNQQMGH